MLNIAICEDQKPEALRVGEMLERYQAQNPQLQIGVDIFCHTDDLIAAISNGQQYHLFLLDVIMPEMDGIALAKTIRTAGRSSAIIFITKSRDFAVEAFAVRATDYLLKPVTEENLHRAISHAVQALGNQVETYTAVLTAGNERRVKVSEIVCVEVMGHSLCYYLAGGGKMLSKVLRISFEEATRDLMEDPRFIRPHRSFLINAAYVKKFTKSEFYMTNNMNIPVSRLRFPTVKQEYMRYLNANETPLGCVMDVPN